VILLCHKHLPKETAYSPSVIVSAAKDLAR
jgi:hypothetical protein